MRSKVRTLIIVVTLLIVGQSICFRSMVCRVLMRVWCCVVVRPLLLLLRLRLGLELSILRRVLSGWSYAWEGRAPRGERDVCCSHFGVMVTMQ